MPVFTVDLSDEVANTIKRMAKQERKSETEIIRQAVGFFSFIKREVGETSEKGLFIIDEREPNRLKKVPIPK